MERPAPLENLRPERQAVANRGPILVGQTLSLFGDYVAYFTLPWLVLELTGRPSDLGLAAFSETIPVLLFGFAAGVVLDRLRMRSVLIFADLVRSGVFGLLAFVLNYIPNIGSFLAAIPPVLLALVDRDLGLYVALLTAGGFVVINVVVGNVIEPRLMGRGLGLSPLVIVVSMVFWGWALGSVGMLLSVPLTMAVKIVLESDPATRSLAVLMGSSGGAK